MTCVMFITSSLSQYVQYYYSCGTAVICYTTANTYLGRNRPAVSYPDSRLDLSLVCTSLPSLAARLSGIICLMKIPKSNSESEVMFLPPTTRIPSPLWQPLMITCWACFFLAAVGDSERLRSANQFMSSRCVRIGYKMDKLAGQLVQLMTS